MLIRNIVSKKSKTKFKASTGLFLLQDRLSQEIKIALNKLRRKNNVSIKK